MKIHTHSAIVLSARDYKENDKLLHLFTPDAGIISAVIKGVKKSGAKLKYAAIPFNFGNYTFSENKGFMTVTGCEQFSDLSLNMAEPDKYIYGEIICEVTENTIVEAAPETFSLFMRALKAMIYEKISPSLLTLKYLLHLWMASGYSKPVSEYRGQSLSSASVLISYIASTDPEKLTEEADETLIFECLKKLLNAICDKFAINLKCIKYL